MASCSSNDRLDGFVHYRLSNNPTTLDPALIVDVSGGNIAAKLFNGLVRLDDNFAIIPDLAESWDISHDGKTYIFHLRKDAKFSNNRPVEPADVRFSIERILDPEGKSPNTWAFEKIEGAKDFMNGKSKSVSGIALIGPQTISIRLERPFAPFLNILCTTPAYILPMDEVKKDKEGFGSHPVGSGPFVLDEWKHNNHLLLRKNEIYFGDKAKVAGIRYRIIPEDLTAVTEYDLGNLDAISVPSSEYSRLMDDARRKKLIVSGEGLNTYYLGFNCSRPPFDNAAARRAVSSAIDKKAILDKFYEKKGRLAHGPVPESLRHWPAPRVPEYNPDEAKRIIRDLGLQGREIQFLLAADPEVVDISEIIQDYLRKAGLNVMIRQLEWSAYKEAVNRGDADIFWLSWWADYPDPENFLFPLFHSSNHGPNGNRARYSNMKVDDLIESGRESNDSKERSEYYSLAEQIIAYDTPWVFFWHKNDIAIRQEHLRNFRLYPIYSMDKGTEVSF